MPRNKQENQSKNYVFSLLWQRLNKSLLVDYLILICYCSYIFSKWQSKFLNIDYRNCTFCDWPFLPLRLTHLAPPFLKRHKKDDFKKRIQKSIFASEQYLFVVVVLDHILLHKTTPSIAHKELHVKRYRPWSLGDPSCPPLPYILTKLEKERNNGSYE